MKSDTNTNADATCDDCGTTENVEVTETPYGTFAFCEPCLNEPVEVEVDRTVETEGHTEHVPEEVLEAVTEAFEQTIGHVVEERSIYWLNPESDREHAVATFGFNYPELPKTSESGEVHWLAPYRAREEVDEKLMETLPEGYTFEAETNSQTGIYRD